MSTFLAWLGEFAVGFIFMFFCADSSCTMKQRIFWATLCGLGTSGVLSYIF